MRYLILLSLALCGCGPSQIAKADEKPVAEKRPTYTEQVAKFEAAVKAQTETIGNNTAELEGIKEELRAVKSGVAEIKSLLSVESEIAVPVPPAEPPPVKVDAPPVEQTGRRVTFHGKPIDVSEWLSTPIAKEQVVEVEINKRPGSRADVEKHVRWHGIEGDLSGFDRDALIHIHSVAHLKDDKPKGKVVMNAAVVIPQSSNCPNCQKYGMQQRSRLFGRSWR